MLFLACSIVLLVLGPNRADSQASDDLKDLGAGPPLANSSLEVAPADYSLTPLPPPLALEPMVNASSPVATPTESGQEGEGEDDSAGRGWKLWDIIKFGFYAILVIFAGFVIISCLPTIILILSTPVFMMIGYYRALTGRWAAWREEAAAGPNPPKSLQSQRRPMSLAAAMNSPGLKSPGLPRRVGPAPQGSAPEGEFSSRPFITPTTPLTSRTDKATDGGSTTASKTTDKTTTDGQSSRASISEDEFYTPPPSPIPTPTTPIPPPTSTTDDTTSSGSKMSKTTDKTPEGQSSRASSTSKPQQPPPPPTNEQQQKMAKKAKKSGNAPRRPPGPPPSPK